MAAVGAAGIVTTALNGGFVPGTEVEFALGRSGEQYGNQLHGAYYSTALAGRLYSLATAAAGTTIPVQATNLVSTFTLLNPLSSNVNVELLTYSLGITNATTVVGDISLYYQTSVGNGNAALATTTALATRNMFLGSGNTSNALGYSAATFTNTVGTNFFRLVNLSTFGAVTTTNATKITTDLAGGVILAPGTAVTVAGSAAQTQAMTQTLVFAEWPI